MGEPAHLLVIGPSEFAAHLAAVLPRCQSVHVEHPLDGLWISTGAPPAAVVIHHPPGHELLRAVECLRRSAPQARIVAVCAPADEPAMRAVLAAGADDYILTPPVRAELEAALRVPPRAQLPIADHSGPSLRELSDLGEVLKHLSAGPQATLDRFTALLHESLGAQFVSIRVDALNSDAGVAGPTVLTAPILRRNELIGAIALGPCRHGAYAATTAARLTDYARLLEIILQQADERAHWQQLACIDEATGLPNHRHFEQELDQRLARAATRQEPLTLLLIDLEGLHSIEGRAGVPSESELLRGVGRLLRACARSGDLVARLGTSEFSVVFGTDEPARIAGSRHPTDSAAVAQRYRQALQDGGFRWAASERGRRAAMCISLAGFPWQGTTRAELLDAAREGLRQSRAAGQNRIVLIE